MLLLVQYRHEIEIISNPNVSVRYFIKSNYAAGNERHDLTFIYHEILIMYMQNENIHIQIFKSPDFLHMM